MIARAACLIFALAAGPAAAQALEGPILIPGAGRDRQDRPGPAPAREQVFISPAGEPFRADPGAPYPVVTWFSRADTDHDGVLTLAEFTADALAFFDTLDADKDQVVDGFESTDYEKDIAPEISGAAAPMARSGSRGGGFTLLGGPRRSRPVQREGAGRYALLNEPHPVRGADSNLDQRVSRAEAEAAAQQRFQLLDVAAAGRLLLADLPQTPVQKMFADRPTDRPPPQGRTIAKD